MAVLVQTKKCASVCLRSKHGRTLVSIVAFWIFFYPQFSGLFIPSETFLRIIKQYKGFIPFGLYLIVGIL